MYDMPALLLAATNANSKEEGAFIAKSIQCLLKAESDAAKARMDAWDVVYNSYKIHAGLQLQKEVKPSPTISGCCAPSFPPKLSATKATPPKLTPTKLSLKKTKKIRTAK